MTDDRIPLAELMAKSGDGDFLRTVAESVLQIIMEADVDGLIGGGGHRAEREKSRLPRVESCVKTSKRLVEFDRCPLGLYGNSPAILVNFP